MPIEILGPDEQRRLRAAGAAAAATLAHVGARLEPGVSTQQIDDWVRAHTRALGGRPSQLGYHGFPAAVCTSVNHVVCHGIPRPDVVLRDGDIVNVDVTTELDGFHGDTSATFCIGQVDPATRALVTTTRDALAAALAAVRPGARLGDLGAEIQVRARAAGYGLVRSYCGHGIGRRMHMDPQVPHFGRAGRGLRLRAGMAFTVEPMLNLGTDLVHVEADGWTVVTADGRPSAQFEHTVLVTETGSEITTRPPSG